MFWDWRDKTRIKCISVDESVQQYVRNELRPCFSVLVLMQSGLFTPHSSCLSSLAPLVTWLLLLQRKPLKMSKVPEERRSCGECFLRYEMENGCRERV